MPELERRTWCYVMPPKAYELAPCDCGNIETQWSEFAKHLWCPVCSKDFIPAHNGIFDGPIPAGTAQMLGISFDRINLTTGKLERFNVGTGGCDRNEEGEASCQS